MPMCGLGVAVGCRMKHAKASVGRVSQSIGGGLPSQQRFKGFSF